MRIFIMAQRISLGVILACLFGCATPKYYDEALRSWKGVPVQFLVKQWGQPTEISTLANGHQFYLYTAVARRSLEARYDNSAYTRSGLQGQQMLVLKEPIKKPSPYNVKFWCDTGFEINDRGVIVTVIVRGNSCVSTETESPRLLSGDQ